MKKTRIAILACLAVFLAPAAWAYNIAIVQSSAIKPYEEARQGFTQALPTFFPPTGSKHIQTINIIDTVILSQLEEPGEELRNLNNSRPDLILAIGNKALQATIKDLHAPILYLLAPDGRKLKAGAARITGIKMDIPAALQLEGFLSIIPSLKNLGIIYNPAKSSRLAAEAKAAAKAKGIRITDREINTPKDFSQALHAMAGKIDAFWMLPDLSIINRHTIETTVLFSLEHQIPIFTFSPKLLKNGYTAAVTFDTHALGLQAAGMAAEIFSSGANSTLPAAAAPTETRVLINRKVATQLGIVQNP